MKSRATPQLLLPLGPPQAEPRRAYLDDSPFDPVESSWEPPSSTPLILNPPTPPARRARTTRSIPPEHAHRLAGELRVLTGASVRLSVHDNRSTMVSFKREEERLHVRVHHMFLDAGPDVVRALADYTRARSLRASRLLDQFVRQHRENIRPVDVEQARARPLQSRGALHDLQSLFDEMNGRYFDNAIEARIGWGRGANGRRRRSIRMGAYYHATKTILIHPALDRPEVPAYFVALVVYHEMLHQAVPQQRTPAGRRCIHTAEFRRRERMFADYDRARAWEKRNLSVLLRAQRTPR